MQQINLFQFVELPHVSTLDTKRALQLTGAFLVLLLFFYFLNILEYHHANSKLAEQNAKLDLARQELMQLAAKYPQSDISTRLIDESKLPLCNIKFSSYLHAFAESIIPGLWLTDIAISDAGRTFVLKGHALQVPFPEIYLEHLKQNAIFKNFNISIDNLDKSQPVLNFQLTAKENNAPG